MKVKLFQQGGGFATFTPIIAAPPQTIQRPQREMGAMAGSTNGSILDDDTFKELLTKGGLVNDVNNLVSNLTELESNDTNPFLNQNNRTMALRMISQVNELRENKNMWTDAVATAKEKGGLGEIAVGDSNEVYVKDHNNIKAMSLNDYAKNRDKYQALTVAELMREREYNPQLAGQNSVFDVANNAIGLNEIKTGITTTIKALGTETTKNSQYESTEQLQKQIQASTGKMPTPDEAKALKGMSEYYKVDQESSSQLNHLDNAVSFIWKSLGSAAQRKLMATAAVNGDVDTKTGAVDPLILVKQMILGEADTTSVNTITPAKLPGQVTAAQKFRPTNAFQLLNDGKTGTTIMRFNDPSLPKQTVMNLIVTGLGSLITPGGRVIGPATLQAISKTEQGAVVDMHNAYLGDQKIPASDLSKISYDGSLAARVYMPVNDYGAPDYHKLAEIQELEQQVDEHPEWSAAQKNDFYHKHGASYINVDNNNEFQINDRFKPFLLMHGFTTGSADSVEGNGKIKALGGQEATEAKEAMAEIYTKEKITSPEHFYSTYYTAPIAIPYIENSSLYSAALSNNLMDTQTTLQNARVNQELSKATILTGLSSSQFKN